MTWKPDYITLAEAKAFMGDTTTTHDADIATAITAASRAIDLCTNRQFGKVSVAEQRFYTAVWDRRRCRWVVRIDDLMSTSGFAAVILDANGATVGTLTEYTLEPRNAAAVSKPWTELVVKSTSTRFPTGARDEVAITALWGWTSVPAAVVEAAKLQTNRLASRRESPYGVAGSPQIGSELRLLARVDPDVAVSLSDYVRWWAGA